LKKGEVFLLPFPKGGTAAPPLEKGDLGGFYIQADPDFDGALLNEGAKGAKKDIIFSLRSWRLCGEKNTK
jgi:hypothetical protein